MIQLQKILVPTDFSDCSRQAWRYATALSEAFDAEVHLIHVLQDLTALAPEPGLVFPPPGNYIQELEASALKALEQHANSQEKRPTVVVQKVLHGPPFVEVVRYARDEDIDLIIMGTHGRSGLAHVLLGSVAEKVVRKAPCPVLTVRPDGHQFEMP